MPRFITVLSLCLEEPDLGRMRLCAPHRDEFSITCPRWFKPFLRCSFISFLLFWCTYLPLVSCWFVSLMLICSWELADISFLENKFIWFFSFPAYSEVGSPECQSTNMSASIFTKFYFTIFLIDSISMRTYSMFWVIEPWYMYIWALPFASCFDVLLFLFRCKRLVEDWASLLSQSFRNQLHAMCSSRPRCKELKI